VACSSFPSCTWERLLFLAKFHFAPIRVGFILLAVTTALRAEDASDDQSLTPYQTALLDYKTGHFQEAYDAMVQADKLVPPGQEAKYFILDSKILTELKRYDEGEKILQSILTPTGPLEVQLALGDLLLRKHSFDRAAKYYSLALQAKPNDPDLMLKVVYTRVGASDLLDAAKYASRLKPFDPAIDPLDPQHPGNPSYYFAKAAIAQATGNAQEAEDDIQTARTLYGITVTNRYLKTYLEVFASSGKNPASDITPPPLIKPTPTGSNP
jgi:tetratricopeptide (TPR) repeat protein